ncbi:MAG: LPS export ABC transporter periplasmic protein LptC [Rickettsiales bacterium]|nr:LPS export ABC transporter periplasmic protein LptC [Rickettsiales bacterium]
MAVRNRHFFISNRHRRLSRFWQSFFAGWGLLFTIILIISPFVFKNMTWAILDAVDMESIRRNNLSMTNLKINGIDKNGDPFSMNVRTALQKFAEPDVIYFTEPTAEITRNAKSGKIRDDIAARSGRFLKDRRKIVLTDNVVVKSSDGTSATANEMEIELK